MVTEAPENLKPDESGSKIPATEVLMTHTGWTFTSERFREFNFSVLLWTTLGLLGCLGMVAFEAFMMWLLVAKR